ncbi:hypothetical protein S245_044358 [Arachis hypogaea]|nr:uncharacterized protein DS421_13g414930 [Arachis hypogaea]
MMGLLLYDVCCNSIALCYFLLPLSCFIDRSSIRIIEIKIVSSILSWHIRDFIEGGKVMNRDKSVDKVMKPRRRGRKIGRNAGGGGDGDGGSSHHNFAVVGICRFVLVIVVFALALFFFFYLILGL